jgi:hypothetical protein
MLNEMRFGGIFEGILLKGAPKSFILLSVGILGENPDLVQHFDATGAHLLRYSGNAVEVHRTDATLNSSS